MLSVCLALAIDPMQLSIGDQNKFDVFVGKNYDSKTEKTVEIDEIANAAKPFRWVYVGESHDNPDAHKIQAQVIAALVKAGRKVVVGMEMYTRPIQPVLNEWSTGNMTEEEFIKKSEWKTQWGFEYSLYKPIFDVVKDNKLSLVGLNVPRDWVRTVSRQGWDSLPQEAKDQLPQLFLDNKEHRILFEALIGAEHPLGAAADGMYRGQVLWDEGMADTAIKWMQINGQDPKTVFVVIAGNGHVMYRQGINYRIERRLKEKGITIVPADIEGEKVTVVGGVADYVVGVPAVNGSVKTVHRQF